MRKELIVLQPEPWLGGGRGSPRGALPELIRVPSGLLTTQQGRWHRNLRSQQTSKQEKMPLIPSKAVDELTRLINRDSIIRMYVTEMIDQVPEAHKVIHCITDLLNHLSHRAPVQQRPQSAPRLPHVGAVRATPLATP